MIQITPQMRILVAVEAVDFRQGIDGLSRVCRQVIKKDMGAMVPIRILVPRKPLCLMKP
jgi:hypothetical protein